MSASLKERLQSRTLIFDGAVGTEIYRKNFFLNTSYEELCLSAPRIIKEIHQAYKDAGCDVLTTNSYGANFLQLNKFLLGDKVRQINEAAVKLAREV
ncbi:MAG: homocysteine S-methyltransferase family protein, partial [Lentisphaeria bacterium]|nr:homocysteine S-methyltransferase family protein [Lentisphaeria bacterium]